MTAEARVAGGTLTLEDDALTIAWKKILTLPRAQRRANPHRIPLEDVQVIELRPPSMAGNGWIRFGATPLDGTPRQPPGDDLTWVWIGRGDASSDALLTLTAAVAEERELKDPLAAAAAERAAPEPEPGIRTFHIHALGPSGSGKTVFMASLYSRLRLRRPDLAFYLKSDHENSLRLNTVFNKIANPNESWPEASQGVMEWEFTACVPTPTGDYEPVRFVYLDYPGGILTNPRAAEDERIQALIGRLRQANALLVLLDGQAIGSLLRGERAGRRYMEFEVTSSLEIAQQSRCPVHFAITKWDLLQDTYSLDEVRARILEDENFADLVAAKAQDTNASIRLFPVSAVGKGFAELQPSGEMKKVGDRPKPENVELPLISVLPDFLQFSYDELGLDAGDIETKTGQKSPVGRWLADQQNASRVQAVVKMAMPRITSALALTHPMLRPLVKLNTDSLVDEAFGFAQRIMVSRAERQAIGRAAYAEELMKQRQEVGSVRTALNLLSLQFEQLLSDFEVAEPASVLAGGLEAFAPTGMSIETATAEGAGEESPPPGDGGPQ